MIEGRPGQDGRVALEIEGLSKAFAGNPALRTVSARFRTGEVTTVVGANGSGKSTLVKILSGYHSADAGAVSVAGSNLDFGKPHRSYELGCRFVHQDLGLIDDATIADNFSYLSGFTTWLRSISEKRSVRRAQEELKKLDLDIDAGRLVATLSPVERTQVAIARALLEDRDAPPQVLILDEPSARLPAEEVARLHQVVRRVASQGVAVILITHFLAEAFGIGDQILGMRDGEIACHAPTGDLSTEELVNLIFSKSAGELDQRLAPEPERTGTPALRVTDLAGENLAGVSFTVQKGEILGITGPTGSGRETVLGTIFGRQPATAGAIEVNSEGVALGSIPAAIRHGVGFLSAERRDSAAADLSATENLTLSVIGRLGNPFHLRKARQMQPTREWFSRFRIAPAGAYEGKMGTFSGGNQQKILLSRLLLWDRSILLLDEPTHGVDLSVKRDIHQALGEIAEAGTSVVLTSSDVEELVQICSRVLVLSYGRVFAEIQGKDLEERVLGAALVGIDAKGANTSERSES